MQSKGQSSVQSNHYLAEQFKKNTGKSYEICISNIMIVFSSMVSAKQKNMLKENLSGIETVKIHELPEAFLQRTNIDSMEIDFCMTDIPDVCRLAQEKGIPSLLYLHDGNKEESMSQIPYAITDFDGIDYAYLCNIAKRFYHIPWTILQTRRCVLREMTEDDLDALYEVYRFCGLGIWVIVLKETNTIIGRAGLAWRDGYDTPEIGFVIAKDYQRQGYAFEVCDAILHYCKEMDLRTIRVLYQKENVASEKLCKKLGFEVKREFEEDGKLMIGAMIELV